MQHRKSISKTLALLLAVALAITALPVIAFAAYDANEFDLSSVTALGSTISNAGSIAKGTAQGDGLIRLYAHNGGPTDVDYELYIVGDIGSTIEFTFSAEVGTNGSAPVVTGDGGGAAVGTAVPVVANDTVTVVGLGERDEITFKKDLSTETVKVRVMTVARVKVNVVGAIAGETVDVDVVYEQHHTKTSDTIIIPTDMASINGVLDYEGGNLGGDGDKITITPRPSGNRTATVTVKEGSSNKPYSAGYELKNAAVYTFTVTFADPPVTPPVYDDDDDDDDYVSSSSGGGGSSSGSSNIPTTVTPEIASNAVNDAVQKAAESGSDTATARIYNPGDVSLDTLKSMQNPDVNVTLNADNLNPSGTGVEVRISLDPSQATKDLDLSASTSDSNARNTNEVFQSYFQNNTNTVSFGQQGDFGQSVRVAVKPDPDLNTDNLHFYAYDKETNTYTQLTNADYFVDANGYVHFTTSVGGNIIMSDGPLTKK